MEERRKIHRVNYDCQAVLVDYETEKKYYVQVMNVSPLGMGIVFKRGTENLVGRDVIIVTDTLIMYATVLRMNEREDGSLEAGIQARKFSQDVLKYLFDHIGK